MLLHISLKPPLGTVYGGPIPVLVFCILIPVNEVKPQKSVVIVRSTVKINQKIIKIQPAVRQMHGITEYLLKVLFFTIKLQKDAVNECYISASFLTEHK